MFSVACVIFGVSLSVLCGSVNSQQNVEIFRDDFNGNSIDSKKWSVTQVASLVNEELEYYTAEDVWQSNGSLYLRSQKRNFGGRDFTSGRVDTKDFFNFTYGAVEWRAKLPAGKGIWPALWLLYWECPVAIPCVTWPPEIDVMEARGDLVNKTTAALHYGRYPNNSYITGENFGPDFSADFHIYKVVWEETKITWFVDGKEFFSVTDTAIIPRDPMYLIMNVAVGGTYSGNPDDNTKFPTEMVIDYVTVLKSSSALLTPTLSLFALLLVSYF